MLLANSSENLALCSELFIYSSALFIYPSTTSILEEDIINEISEVRSKRYFI